MKRGRAEAIFEQVRAAVRRWPEFANAAGVNENWCQQIQKNQRLDGY